MKKNYNFSLRVALSSGQKFKLLLSAMLLLSAALLQAQISITNPCVCLNNATTLTNGQFNETIVVHAPAGQTWTVSAVSGLYTTGSAAPPAAPTPIAIGTVLVASDTTYTLNGRHVDAIGYTVSVSNGLGTTLSIGNSCQYPNPTVSTNLSSTICLHADPVPLIGTPGDANIVSAGFTVNGVPETVFNPAAGVGAYTITYTVNGGMPKANGPNDPGCIQTISQIVNVVETPDTMTCRELTEVSLNENCTLVLVPEQILLGTYGCYEDFLVEFDTVKSYGNGPWVSLVFGPNDLNKTYFVRIRQVKSGNRCWGDVKIKDKLAPVVTCQDMLLTCAISPYSPAYLQDTLHLLHVYPTITDNCSPYSRTYADTWHDLSCTDSINGLGDIAAYVTRVWTAKDTFNNTGVCTQNIYFERRHVSDVVFPADVTVSCANGNTAPLATGVPYINELGIDWPVYGIQHFCELSATYSDTMLPVCDGNYKIRRTWTVTDACMAIAPSPPANPISFLQTIQVMDGTGPTMTCPANLTVSTDPFACCAVVDLLDIIISDNCSRINNISAKVFNFNPTTGAPLPTLTVSGTLTTFPDNNLSVSDTLGNFGITPCLSIGTHPVEYRAEDDCGNISTCSFQLTVADLVPPTSSCMQLTTVLIGTDDPNDCYVPSAGGCDFAGIKWIPAKNFDLGSADHCNHVKFTIRRMAPYSPFIESLNKTNGFPDCSDGTMDTITEYNRATAEQDSIKFYCAEVGTTQSAILRIYQTDVNGQIMTNLAGLPIYSDCMVNVEIRDNVKPKCVAPAPVNVLCQNFDKTLLTYGNASVSDNCCLDTSKVYQGQCGLTHTVNYSQFDTVCSRGTITRTFRAFDCHGFSSFCTQQVIVEHTQDYFVKFPDDLFVTVCAGGLNQFGQPTFYGETCELLSVTFTDELFTVIPNACYKIERTWKVINWCTYNPGLPCVTIPNPVNDTGPTLSASASLPAPAGPEWNATVTAIATNPSFDYSTLWNANANCYTYKQVIRVSDTEAPILQCPASPVQYCDETPNNPQLWNESYWLDPGLSSHDLCEGPADLILTGTDNCSGSRIRFRYLLFLDLDNNGSMETVVNSANLPASGTVAFGNANNANYSGGTVRNFDQRTVPAALKYRFALQTYVTGLNKTAAVRWNTNQNPTIYVVPELPYGTHKIRWFVEDDCGVETVCEYTFVVKDCKAPTVVCKDDLNVDIMPIQMIQLGATDFLENVEDNCTPTDQIKVGVVRSDESTGVFPVNPDGSPQLSVAFTCAELGNQAVQLWTLDAAGNASFCETNVLVQDNNGHCPQAGVVTVAGLVATESNVGLQDAEVDLQATAPGMSLISLFRNTSETGHYAFSNAVPLAANVTVTPTEDANHINGVSTFDLVLISKHILGIEPLTSPYKMIAADANKSNSITTFDIAELRKLVLGIYTALPNNTSWRFVDKSFNFPNAANPWETVFPENKTTVEIQQSQFNDDFVAVKIGDINGSAISSNLMSADDRTAGTLLFDIQDRAVKAGETFEVSFQAAEQVTGYQFTMNHAGLEIVDVVPGANMTLDNFGVLKVENALTTSFDGTSVGAFTVRFRATQAGALSKLLSVSSRITHAESYSVNNDKMEVGFRFSSATGTTLTGVGFELYQNQPNPFVHKTFVGFHLPAAAQATLTVYDETGRMLFTQQGDFAKGYNQIAIDAATILPQGSGMLYYKVATATDAATRKMIQIK